MTAAIRSEVSVNESGLYVAFELGKKDWKLAMTSGFGIQPWLQTVAAGDLDAVARALTRGRQRFGLAATSRVCSCYEAGRDGFWIHRALVARGLENRVVDSASIEVNRRARRTKTDRIDALKLVMMLVRACCGERRVFAEVRVPSAAAEAARHRSRERTGLVQEQTRLRNQIGSWLATCGCRASARMRQQPAWWTRVREWAGAPLPPPVQARIARAEARLAIVADQLATIDASQRATVREAEPQSAHACLVRLKGVATTSASVLVDEGLVWRAFQNRRQLGGLLGFAPAKYDSGESERDQGISRAGNKRLQSVMVQLAWGWVRWQPQSALTRWYQERFGRGKRARRVGIVALARKLVIALWRYATAGVLPAGAVLKGASAPRGLARVGRVRFVAGPPCA
jgi:transposase